MFFKETTANFLQQVSVFIEIIGFIFVIIELYFPVTGRNIEKMLDRMSSLDWWYESEGKSRRRFLLLGYFQSIVVVLFTLETMNVSRTITFYTILILTIILINRHIYHYGNYGCLVGLVVGILFTLTYFPLRVFFIIIGIPFYFITALTSKILSFFNYIGKGKAIGASGLFLSLIGIFFEAYQVVTICITNGCYGY